VALDYVNDELRMFPGLVLRLADIEGAATNVTQVHITRTHGDFAGQKAIGGAVVATVAALVEHQLRAVFGLELRHQFQSRWRSNDSEYHQKKPSLFSL
jgi:hypothetical protein